MAETDAFTKLPLDVIFQILIKLPTESLLQLRCVSKYFPPIISHPHFLKLHLSSSAGAAHRHHLIYYESTDYKKSYFAFNVEKTFSLCKILETPFKSVHGYLRIVGSTKGIVCLFDTNYFTHFGTVILWNPFIGKFKILPFPQELNNFRNNLSHMVVGFGFDHRNINYKVVQILYDCNNEHSLLPKALIFGLKIGSWKSTTLVVPCFMPRNWSSSVCINGIAHWLAYKKPTYNSQPNCIMGFDLVDEEFKSMELPQNLGPNPVEIQLSPLFDEKSLALFVTYHGNGGERWDLWLMNDYGKAESWTMNKAVVLERVFFPLRVLNGGGVLASMSGEKLVFIDVEKEEILDLEVCGLMFYVDDYLPSLAMLDVGEQFPK